MKCKFCEVDLEVYYKHSPFDVIGPASFGMRYPDYMGEQDKVLFGCNGGKIRQLPIEARKCNFCVNKISWSIYLLIYGRAPFHIKVTRFLTIPAIEFADLYLVMKVDFFPHRY